MNPTRPTDLEPAEPFADRPLPDPAADIPERVLIVDDASALARGIAIHERTNAEVIGIDPSAGDDLTGYDRVLQTPDGPVVEEIKVRYRPGLSALQMTTAMVNGTTPREITQASWRAPVKPRRADPKAKAKRKQARASRARNRK